MMMMTICVSFVFSNVMNPHQRLSNSIFLLGLRTSEKKTSEDRYYFLPPLRLSSFLFLTQKKPNKKIKLFNKKTVFALHVWLAGFSSDAALTRQIGLFRHISKSTRGPTKLRMLSMPYMIIVGLQKRVVSSKKKTKT